MTMATTLSLVPLQALSTSVPNGSQIQMTGPYILVRATTVAQQVQAKRQLKSQEVCKKTRTVKMQTKNGSFRIASDFTKTTTGSSRKEK